MDYLIYEDNNPWILLSYPWYKRVMLNELSQLRTLQMMPIYLVIFIAGLFVALTQVEQEAVFFTIIGITLFLMLALWFALLPTKYQIFNDRIRIALGWLFHFDIPFSNIENVTAATWQDSWGLNLNFVVRYSSDDILQIIRKHGAKIYISPSNRKLFLEHFNQALTDWRRSNLRT